MVRTDGDVLAGQLDGQTAGQIGCRRLARPVHDGAAAGAGAASHLRGDDRQLAGGSAALLTPCQQMWQKMAGGEKHPGDIGHQRVLDSPAVLFGVLNTAASGQHAGIADQQIECAAKPGGDWFHVAFDPHIEAEDAHPVGLPGECHQLGSLHRGAATGDHLVTHRGRLAGHFQPDATVGAGDHHASGGAARHLCTVIFVPSSGLPHVGHALQAAALSPMIAGSKGVRENTSRSIGSKWLSGLVGYSGSKDIWSQRPQKLSQLSNHLWPA